MTKDIEQPEIIKLELPADVKYLETVSLVLQSVLDRIAEPFADSQSEFAIKLAVHEAFANIIEHAYHGRPGPIQIEMQITHTPPKIVVELVDQGEEADPNKFKKPNLEEPQIRGYGLYLIAHLVDQVHYSREGGNNRWRLVKTM